MIERIKQAIEQLEKMKGKKVQFVLQNDLSGTFEFWTQGEIIVDDKVDLEFLDESELEQTLNFINEAYEKHSNSGSN